MIKKFNEKGIKTNRWLIRYFNFLDFCKNTEKENEYTEIHHILPQSMFNEYIKDKNNLIKLSYREHILAHYILAKAVGGTMWYAVQLMGYNKLNSTLISEAKKENNKIRKTYITVYDIDKKENRNILIEDYDPFYHLTNSRKFSHMPDDYLKKLYIMDFNKKYKTNFNTFDFGKNYKKTLHKIRCSINQQGESNIAKRPEVQQKMRESKKIYFETNHGHNKGKKVSEETKKKQSESAKNRTKPNRTKQYNLISPEGVVTFCDGNLGNTVNKFKLSLTTIKRFKGIVVPKELRSRYNTELRNNTTGWTLIEL